MLKSAEFYFPDDEEEFKNCDLAKTKSANFCSLGSKINKNLLQILTKSTNKAKLTNFLHISF